MFGLLDGIKVGVGAVFGLLLGIVAMGLYGHFVALPDARDAGRQEERIVWQERQARAVAKAEEDRQVAEAKIRDAEADMLRQDAAHAEQMAALEEALQEEKNDVEPTPPPGAAGACRPALPRGRVQRELDKLGRTAAPRSDPAEPHRAVP